ncbi:hypothetical protein [Kocuria coralli]|uniref:hypothetical protein n=1 Tax=Kocuria coralli TaxID=1461025 RepID=UPI0015F2E586|nr:hypothetical protein [Kocuria coralli]
MNTLTFGREITDAELSAFHGGSCTVRITRNGNGQVTQVDTIGGCQNVQINIQA